MTFKGIQRTAMGLILPAILFARAESNRSLFEREAVAYRLTDSKIRVDGILDEQIWKRIPTQGEFLQRNPEDGAPASQSTEFSICYDEENLYIGVRAYDSDPSQITGILTRRDESSPSDWVYVSIDSYHDYRTAFEFGLNAAGVKQDLRRFDDTNMDFDWEAVWEGAVHHGASGWSAEFAIPFRELRFNSNQNPTWGLNVYREIPRNDNELAIWSYWSREESGFVSNYGELTGLSNLETRQPLYISPYISGQTGANDAVLNKVDEYEALNNIGADLRKNFEIGLTFTGTINPDFGQVEADPADFNLTEFETYFREKRPFFMEGSNILNFSLGVGDGDLSSNSLFYSRRIGRAPQGHEVYEKDEVLSVSKPDQVRIIGAGKFTGKLGNGLSLGVMSAATAEEKAVVTYSDGTQSENVIEPATTYVLTRVQQDFRDGQTTLGGITTLTQRNLDGTNMDWLRKQAITSGVDLMHHFYDRKYRLEAKMAYSKVSGSKEAIVATQTNSSRYFQRPDAPHVHVDSSATSLAGWGGLLVFGKSGGRIEAMAGVIASSPGFEINDMGYTPSVDNISQFIWVGFRNYDANRFLLNSSYNLNQWANWSFGGERKGMGGNVNGHITFLNNWQMGGGINKNIGGLSTHLLRGGPAIQGPDNLSIWAYMNTDTRKDLYLTGNINYFENDDEVISVYLAPSLGWRPKRNISLNLGPDFHIFNDTWAWITTAEDAAGDAHYIFSDLSQVQTSLTFRANITLSTTLSVQYYTQAFLTAGEYSNYTEVNDNRAKDYNQRFAAFPEYAVSLDDAKAFGGVDFDQDGILDYVPTSYVYSDFNYKQLSSNLVVRWEYSTGSVMYLVWSRGASAYDPSWHYSYADDMKEVLGLDADNIFMIKINKLLNI